MKGLRGEFSGCVVEGFVFLPVSYALLMRCGVELDELDSRLASMTLLQQTWFNGDVLRGGGADPGGLGRPPSSATPPQNNNWFSAKSRRAPQTVLHPLHFQRSGLPPRIAVAPLTESWILPGSH